MNDKLRFMVGVEFRKELQTCRAYGAAESLGVGLISRLLFVVFVLVMAALMKGLLSIHRLAGCGINWKLLFPALFVMMFAFLKVKPN